MPLARRQFLQLSAALMATTSLPGLAATARRRPKAIAFDVIETLFDLSALRPAFEKAGLPPHGLELFFAQMLRDGFALEASGELMPFGELARNTLKVTSANLGKPLNDEQIGGILSQVAALPPHPDVVPTIEYLHQQGITLITLTNSSPENTDKLLSKAGVRDKIAHLWPASGSGHWKPNGAPYAYAAEKLGIDISEFALIAAHPWDIHGAVRAGATGAYIQRQESLYQPSFAQAHFSDTNMLNLAKTLMALPG